VPGVKPARYRGRFYWITIVNVSRFPHSYLTELVQCSYQRAFASLSKARQTAVRASDYVGDVADPSGGIRCVLTRRAHDA